LRISQDLIDRIRDATDIVEYIGGFVKLRKRGKNYRAVSVSPGEDPSFSVSADARSYHCFSMRVGHA
jgi:DNA primase